MSGTNIRHSPKQGELFTCEQAEAAGFTVDTTCYPWVAYKGPRFCPSEWRYCLTHKESELLEALEMFVEEWPKRGSDNDVDVAFGMAQIAIKRVRGQS